MRQVVIKEFTDVFHRKGEVWIDGQKVADTGEFVDVTPEWIYIYETGGGHDYSIQGRLLRKIWIGDCELKIEKTKLFQE